MRSVFFTKPKKTTVDFLRFMISQGEVLHAVVLHGKDQYEGSDLVDICIDNEITVVDYDDCDDLFLSLQGKLDMIWCHTFPKIVKGAWLDTVSVAAVNFHPAPLPEYRGAFLYNFAILNGESEYGVTAHLMSERFDEGSLIEVDRFPFDCSECSLADLVSISEEKLLALAKRTYLRFAAREEMDFVPQAPGSGRYYSRKLFEETKRIDLGDDAETICRKIRAFWYPPHEGAYIEVAGERFCLVTKEMLDGLR